MAPMHEWKDDAEFIRYNRPYRPSLLKRIGWTLAECDPVGCLYALSFPILIVFGVWVSK